MSGEARLDLQKAIYTALTGDSTLMGKISGVFDFVPQDQQFPFVVIGDGTIADASTMTSHGQEHTLMIHSWSRYEGRAEIYGIMADVYRILHEARLSVQNNVLAYLLFDWSQTLRDPDGITQHGVQRFKALTQGV